MCCVALPCCLFDFVCSFLSSFLSLIKTCTCTCTCTFLAQLVEHLPIVTGMSPNQGSSSVCVLVVVVVVVVVVVASSTANLNVIALHSVVMFACMLIREQCV